MKRLILDIPDNIELNEKEAKDMLAANLYEVGKLSLGQAAEFAGHSKRAFMEILGAFNVSIFSDSEETLENDIANAKSYHI